MVQVVWLNSAFADLDEIGAYIARDSKPAAEQLGRRIVQASRRLELFPRSGRIVPEYGRDDLREVIVEGYRVVYRLEVTGPAIVAVRHGARRLQDIPGV